MRRRGGLGSALTGGLLLAVLTLSLAASPVGAQEDGARDTATGTDTATDSGTDTDTDTAGPTLQVQRFDPPVARPGADLDAAGTFTAGDADLTDVAFELEVATGSVSTRGQLGAFAVGAQTPTTTQVPVTTADPADQRHLGRTAGR